MLCYFCSSPKTRVVDSRDSEEGREVRRRRVCDHCRKRFTTYEQVEAAPIRIHKRGGQTEEYQLAKIRTAVATACRKRPLTPAALEALVLGVDSAIRAMESVEVPSSAVGDLVLERLKTLDQVAYIRFASVYKRFESIDGFRKIVDEL